MQVVPVIDLKGGLVVRARRGERDAYQPISSSLAQGAAPLDIAAALLRLHPFETLYIADIDAIQQRGSNSEPIAAIRAAFPAVELWIDAGISDQEDLLAWQTAGVGRAVIGTERVADPTLIDGLRALQSGPRPLLSLDFGAHGLVGSTDILADPSAWPDDVIVMTLDRVGTSAGPNLRLFSTILGRTPGRRVYAAGGVRGVEDLFALSRLGAAGALVASSLHDGCLTRADLARIESPPRA